MASMFEECVEKLGGDEFIVFRKDEFISLQKFARRELTAELREQMNEHVPTGCLMVTEQG